MLYTRKSLYQAHRWFDMACSRVTGSAARDRNISMHASAFALKSCVRRKKRERKSAKCQRACMTRPLLQCHPSLLPLYFHRDEGTESNCSVPPIFASPLILGALWKFFQRSIREAITSISEGIPCLLRKMLQGPLKN